MDGVRKTLNARGMDVREAKERTRNRNEWRIIVNEAVKRGMATPARPPEWACDCGNVYEV